jgi:hypothetical protein
MHPLKVAGPLHNCLGFFKRNVMIHQNYCDTFKNSLSSPSAHCQ